MAIGDNGTPCTVVLHDNAVSKDDVLCGGNVLPEGRIAYLNAPGTKTLCVHAQAAAKNADEVSSPRVSSEALWIREPYESKHSCG